MGGHLHNEALVSKTKYDALVQQKKELEETLAELKSLLSATWRRI